MASLLSKTERQLFTAATTRHGRRKHGVSLCEGSRCVTELLHKCPDWVIQVIVTENFSRDKQQIEINDFLKDSPYQPICISESEFRKYAQTANPQGIAALFRPHPQQGNAHTAHTALPPFALVLDRIAEPGNMGTILRTAWAVGLNKVWLTAGCVDPYSPKTIRAGMGAQFALDIIQNGSLSSLKNELQEIGFTTMWLSKPGKGISSCSDNFSIPDSAVVIGNEANGVDDVPGAQEVTIPMPGHAESLNASQAATILLYEAVRRNILN